jgi:hypothetical protein
MVSGGGRRSVKPYIPNGAECVLIRLPDAFFPIA